MRTLADHGALPGHRFQIGIARELGGSPTPGGDPFHRLHGWIGTLRRGARGRAGRGSSES